MKRHSAFPITVVVALIVAGAVMGQDPQQWRPAVVPVPQAPASVQPSNWQPAVYSPVPAPMTIAPSGYAPAPEVTPGVTGCSDPVGAGTGRCPDCGGQGCFWCGGWLRDRFGICGLWGGVEFLHVWAHGRMLPPLITTSPDGTPRGSAGVLPGATILFGGERIGDDRQSAGRVTFGVWLDDCENTGLAARFFAIEGANDGATFVSNDTGSPILGAPFFNVSIAANDAVLASYPNEQRGFIDARTSQDVIMGEGLLRTLLLRGNGYRLDLLGGYLYSQVSDGLDYRLNTTIIDPGSIFPIGSNFDFIDRFDARNDFHGATAGLMGELRHYQWRIHAMGKISFGNVRQELTVSGQQTIDIPGGGGPITGPGGIYAQPSNSGTFVRNETTYIPEAYLGIGYQVNRCLELTAGYTFIYWADVITAGDQIDTSIDFSGGTRPVVTLRDTDFWVMGVSLGASWNY
ncbi:MAG: hypothetical protein KatS3mg110_0585 [Pirellulaceae bacterium]|nr:MAG: hypothetical protein KatS3mg110_0585 [Pirellulaceae bacterium]